jgi:hypothetical protein
MRALTDPGLDRVNQRLELEAEADRDSALFSDRVGREVAAALGGMQLVLGIVGMVAIANLQYGWTLFVNPTRDCWSSSGASSWEPLGESTPRRVRSSARCPSGSSQRYRRSGVCRAAVIVAIALPLYYYRSRIVSRLQRRRPS